MESFAVDRNLYEVNDVWENDDFDSISMEDSFSTNDPDWTCFLDQGPAVILNDKMITDALHSPRMVPSSSDHSYSLMASESEMGPDSPLADSRGGLDDFDKDLESECFPAIPMSEASSRVYIKQEPMSPPSSPQPQKPSQSVLKQPTIILATRPHRNTILPKVNIKVETGTNGFSLPPTPPSSTSSDSEGSRSPDHNPQPCSPSSSNGRQRQHTNIGSSKLSNTHTSLISSQPKGATGTLMLTEEEKRTLLAEGYPIPSRLPLSKAEEKSLKKIRRKIKNKISAQESRRKKKEYMDALEKKVEILNTENSDYKKQVDSLETNNKSLLSQLHKLQSMLGGVPSRVSRTVSTQTAGSLMLVVLCFALCVGGWGVSLMTSSIGSSNGISAGFFASPVCLSDPYTTPTKRSRILMAFLDEWESEISRNARVTDEEFELASPSHESFDKESG